VIQRIFAIAAAGLIFVACSGGMPSVYPSTQSGVQPVPAVMPEAVPISPSVPSATAVPLQPDPLAVAADTLAATARPSVFLPPAGTIYLGARVRPNGAYSQADVRVFERQIGRTLALNNHYHSWTTAWPNSEEMDDRSNHRIPVVAWDCGGSDYNIAKAGSGGPNAVAINAQIDKTAAAVKGYGSPIMIRWFWEMNLDDGSNGGRTNCWDSGHDLTVGANHYFSPKWFAAAFNYIVARFKADGATNVAWIWCPSAGGQPLAPYYPGDTATDWLSFDNYSHGTSSTMADTMQKWYAQLVAVNSTKPILVAESAAIQSNQVHWLTGAGATLKSSFPNIKGFMYFDALGISGDWILSSAALQQFALFGHAAYMSAP